MDKVRVKGKHEPVTIYTAMSLEEGRRRAEELEKSAKALTLYQSGDFAEAYKIYSDLMPAGGRLYDLYAQRCHTLMESPLPKDWDGVFTHETK